MVKPMTYRQSGLVRIGALFAVSSLSVLLSGNVSALDRNEQDYQLKLLGKYVFFDKISNPPRMACVTCHDPATGGTGSVSGVNLRQVAITGANPHRVGGLKPPTNAYASLIDPFQRCGRGGLGAANNHCGGNFWDGRAEGRLGDVAAQLFPDGATKHIGAEVFQPTHGQNVSGQALLYRQYFGPTSDQALNPMPNPVEQNIDRQSVCRHVASAKYAELYRKAWGVDIDCRDTPVADASDDVVAESEFDISFKRIMLAVGAWQDSRDNNSFSSKRDIALRRELAGIDVDETPGEFPLVGLTDQENLGHDLFYNTRPIPFLPRTSDGGPPNNEPPFPNLPEARCSFCHSDDPADTGAEPQQLYADDAYHNIATPFNPELPADPNPGAAGHMVGATIAPGFFKTPTVRNVDKRKGKGFIKAYAHNGWFKSLESLVHFYNTSAIGLATAESFGITRCRDRNGNPLAMTEKEALAANCWPEPEWPGASPVLVGNLGMTAEEETAIVAYLKTLTDTHTAKAPPPYKTAQK